MTPVARFAGGLAVTIGIGAAVTTALPRDSWVRGDLLARSRRTG